MTRTLSKTFWLMMLIVVFAFAGTSEVWAQAPGDSTGNGTSATSELVPKNWARV